MKTDVRSRLANASLIVLALLVWSAWHVAIGRAGEAQRHWSLVPPRRVPLSEASGGSSPIDAFVRQRLAIEGLTPSPEADRATLLRRVSLDLTGLPPSPEEVDAFVCDRQSDAYDRVVDRLLASPHFGERWARWWLDLAHYADSDGYLQDFHRPTAWRYRDWVVDAFNSDLPFDQFTVEQLAGDLLPQATDAQRVATGFLRNTLSNREGGADLEEFRVKQVVDRTSTFGTTWLALTVGCAECHDHKYDDVSQREFYQLYAFFNQADEVNVNAPLPGELEPWRRAQPAYDRQRAALLAPVAASLAELQADWERKLLDAETNPDADFAWQRALEVLGLIWGQGLGEGQLEGLNIVKTPLAERTQEQCDKLLDYFLANAPDEYAARLRDLGVEALRTQLEELRKTLPPMSRAPAMTQTRNARTTAVHIRGDFRQRDDDVTPTTPALLPPLTPSPHVDRLALARWLATPGHPLTARVVVNRWWQELFGTGIVATSEDFGVRGEAPTFPELLDWLALELQDNDWSVKRTLRTIVLSHAYRQASVARPELSARDPHNRLVARQRRLRLTAETVRDAALAASGLLHASIGGPSVRPPQPDSVSMEAYSNTWETSRGPDRHRRGLYTFLQRTTPFAQFVTFDFPDASRCCARRQRTTTPLQALELLNDPVFVEAAQALAARVERETVAVGTFAHDALARRIERLFRLALARPPAAEESQRLADFYRQQRDHFAAQPEQAASFVSVTYFNGATHDGDQAERAAWTALCSIVLNLDEFVNRE